MLPRLAVLAAAVLLTACGGTATPDPDPTRAAMADLRSASETKAAEPTSAPCLSVSPAFVAQLVGDLEVDGGATATGSAAMPVAVSDSDEGEWYLVALRVDGPGVTGMELVWATTVDPTAAEPAGGLVFATDSVTDEFSVYPAPDDVKARFRSGGDRQAVLGCMG